jgi:hypothetical protein
MGNQLTARVNDSLDGGERFLLSVTVSSDYLMAPKKCFFVSCKK